jgi:hypothetical protein
MNRDRIIESVLDALKVALSSPAEQRLYKSGKLEGLFASRAGVNGEAAALALREGLLEVVRTEPRGKTVFEWVRPTPRAVEYLHEHESPLAILEDLRELLRMNRNALPGWMAEIRQGLGNLVESWEKQARGWMEKLGHLSARVEQTLAQLEKMRPALADEVITRVSWAPIALTYLDHRQQSGAAGQCTLPELFEVLRGSQPDLSVSGYHEGLRYLQERRALRLLPIEMAECSQPEFALLDGSHVLYRVAV